MFTRNWCVYLLAAIMLALAPQNVFSQQTPQSHVLYGTVYSASTGQPVTATITVTSCNYARSTLTGTDGSWRLAYPYGPVGRISFSASGYESQTFEITSVPQWFYAGGIMSLQPLTK